MVLVCPAQILRAQARRQRCAEVQALPRNCCAVYSLVQASIHAGRIGLIPLLTTPEPGKREILARLCCPVGAKASKAGVSYHPLLTLGTEFGVANRLIVEEGENLVLPDRATDAAAELIEIIVVSLHLLLQAVEALVGV